MPTCGPSAARAASCSGWPASRRPTTTRGAVSPSCASTATATSCARSRRGSRAIPTRCPRCPSYADGIPADAYGVIQQAPSVDGSMSYRVILQRSRPTGTTLAVAAPLAGVDAAVGALIRTLLLTGTHRADRAARRGLDRRPPRPAPARADLARRGRHRRRRPDPPDRRPPRQHRGRAARDGVRRDARPDRGRASASSRRRSTRRPRARSGCAGSSPTPRTSCARRSPPSAATPTCTGQAA